MWGHFCLALGEGAAQQPLAPLPPHLLEYLELLIYLSNDMRDFLVFDYHE